MSRADEIERAALRERVSEAVTVLTGFARMSRASGFPPNTMACHTCDNPPCVNPAHIWPGSMSDNILDAVSKGRFVKHQAMKTHCPRGHAYTAGNIYWSKTGGRHCMECHRMHLKTWRARRRAALKEPSDVE